MPSPLTTAKAEGTDRDEYRTPEEIFHGLDCDFHLDVASPMSGPSFVPAMYKFTREDDGLNQDWGSAFVWMNPPFGKRDGVRMWLEAFFGHGNGIGLVGALTSSGWFHDYMPRADGLFFPRGKTKFIRPDGTVAKQPASGIVLFAAGEIGKSVLRNCSLDGMYLETPNPQEN